MPEEKKTRRTVYQECKNQFTAAIVNNEVLMTLLREGNISSSHDGVSFKRVRRLDNEPTSIELLLMNIEEGLSDSEKYSINKDKTGETSSVETILADIEKLNLLTGWSHPILEGIMENLYKCLQEIDPGRERGGGRSR